MGRFSGAGGADRAAGPGDTFADRATSPFLVAANRLQEWGRGWHRCGIRNT
ncbi:protein of unassigned function [Methylobacterium oryzae CBMB20]|uniref:Protein of unassigned function n=1 Tax=Methylobacterium oryzae CBMB20 TaxID=693986 RepID=A0A089NR82_9HYPH|nr:protein of unassigned function [Methylobacterium oryzae CBMB20]